MLGNGSVPVGFRAPKDPLDSLFSLLRLTMTLGSLTQFDDYSTQSSKTEAPVTIPSVKRLNLRGCSKEGRDDFTWLSQELGRHRDHAR